VIADFPQAYCNYILTSSSILFYNENYPIYLVN
jgi:hypothetical protein